MRRMGPRNYKLSFFYEMLILHKNITQTLRVSSKNPFDWKFLKILGYIFFVCWSAPAPALNIKGLCSKI